MTSKQIIAQIPSMSAAKRASLRSATQRVLDKRERGQEVRNASALLAILAAL